MLTQLKNIIFGLDEYEKVKIETRIQNADNLITNLKIHNKIEFETIEDVISKIKEQLRIKSSNLNCVIKDSSRNITKKTIDELLNKLNEIKYEFLDIAEKHINYESKKKETKIDNIYKNIIKEEKFIEEDEDEIIETEVISKPKIKESEKYKEINTVERIKPTKKHEEDSLDALLQEVQEKRKEIHTQKANNDSNVILETNNETIKIEHEKQEATIKNEAIEIEHETDLKYIIYQDKNILVHLKTDSKVPGEILIESTSQKKLEELNEEELSYMVAFSKIFASVAFEVLDAHGTNIHWNYKDNQIHIIPRFQNDGIDFTWTPKTLSSKKFEEIKEKLINDMLKELPKTKNNENNSTSTHKEINNENPTKENSIERKKPQKKEVVEGEIVSSHSTKSEEQKLKIQQILDALNKIP